MWTIDIDGPSYGYRDYVRCLGRINRGLENNEDHFVLNFSSVNFFYPDGMAPLIATIHRLVGEGKRFQVETPTAVDMDDYWQKVGWTAGLTGEEPPPLDRASSFLPLTPYHTADQLNAFLTEALHMLAETEVFPSGVLDAFAWSINEMADNVLLHADTTDPGWIQLTTYPHKRQIEFVVVDTGQGVLCSLSPSYPDLADDKQALLKAVEKGVRRSRETQGNGLSGTLRIATSANGWANLQSGGGQIRLLEGDMYSQMVASHQGMVVALTLPTGNPIDLSQALWGHKPMPAFEMDYLGTHGIEFRVADQEKNYGNRATGERLRLKLMNVMNAYPDDAVIIDFDGIELMSASFADEFVAKLHQELGMMTFWGRFKFRNTTGFVAQTIERVIEQRQAEG